MGTLSVPVLLTKISSVIPDKCVSFYYISTKLNFLNSSKFKKVIFIRVSFRKKENLTERFFCREHQNACEGQTQHNTFSFLKFILWTLSFLMPFLNLYLDCFCVSAAL